MKDPTEYIEEGDMVRLYHVLYTTTEMEGMGSSGLASLG